jgi:hypothetical protein
MSFGKSSAVTAIWTRRRSNKSAHRGDARRSASSNPDGRDDKPTEMMTEIRHGKVHVLRSQIPNRRFWSDLVGLMEFGRLVTLGTLRVGPQTIPNLTGISRRCCTRRLLRALLKPPVKAVRPLRAWPYIDGLRIYWRTGYDADLSEVLR